MRQLQQKKRIEKKHNASLYVCATTCECNHSQEQRKRLSRAHIRSKNGEPEGIVDTFSLDSQQGKDEKEKAGEARGWETKQDLEKKSMLDRKQKQE